MDDAAGEEEASMFETSHVLGALLASSPLLASAWDRCTTATAAAPGFVHGEDGGKVYVAELAMKLEELQEFERYSRELVANKEVSVDVLAPQSSYTLWVEEWNQLKLRDEVRTLLLQF
ncbi:Lipase-like PAD4 [Zea mays]|uniref:Lipase-like PAD4 n=1 Tax=Zea mays TaxID=4577 RepID=A0A1D6QMC4_MAIZE|nr:Lipase-like PAD4 [Zea mays]